MTSHTKIINQSVLYSLTPSSAFSFPALNGLLSPTTAGLGSAAFDDFLALGSGVFDGCLVLSTRGSKRASAAFFRFYALSFLIAFNSSAVNSGTLLSSSVIFLTQVSPSLGPADVTVSFSGDDSFSGEASFSGDASFSTIYDFCSNLALNSSINCWTTSRLEASSMVAGKLYGFPLEIFLIVPLKILPDLVFGSLLRNKTPFKFAKAPTSSLIFVLISFHRASFSAYESNSQPAFPFRITKASGHSPRSSSSYPMTALSTTLSCSLMTSSSLPVDILCPHVLMTSSILVMMCMYLFRQSCLHHLLCSIQEFHANTCQ